MSHQPFDDNPASHAFGVVSDQEAVVQGAGAGAGGGFPLAEEHARALLLDFSADLLGVTGFDGRVRWANPAHEAKSTASGTVSAATSKELSANCARSTSSNARS